MVRSSLFWELEENALKLWVYDRRFEIKMLAGKKCYSYFWKCPLVSYNFLQN